MKKKQSALGIDLGTTFSCAGIWENNNVKIIENEYGERTTPSIVCFSEDNIYIGKDAYEYKKLNPSQSVFAIKRILGLNFNDKNVQEDIKNWPFKVIEGIDNKPLIQIKTNNKIVEYYPEEISAKILTYLVKNANDYLNKKITKVVIATPHNFTNNQRIATINAGKIANLEVLDTTNCCSNCLWIR